MSWRIHSYRLFFFRTTHLIYMTFNPKNEKKNVALLNMSCHVVEYVVNECFWKRTHCKAKFQNPSCPNYLFSSINNMMTIPIVADNLSCGLGAEFVVPFFFSSSRSFALKSSSKSHQMTPFFIQNKSWEQNDVVLVKLYHLEQKKCHLMTFWGQLESKRTRTRGKRNNKFKLYGLLRKPEL